MSKEIEIPEELAESFRGVMDLEVEMERMMRRIGTKRRECWEEAEKLFPGRTISFNYNTGKMTIGDEEN